MKSSQKRDHIIQAALDLIAEHGFHGTPMSLVAEKAGVGTGTIYRYFESKDALISGIYVDVERKITAAMMEGYMDDKPIRERFIFLCEKLLRYFLDNPLYFRFIEQYFQSPYGVDCRRDKLMEKNRQRDVFREIFDQGVAQQILKDLPHYAMAALTIMPIVSMARDHILALIQLDDDTIVKTIEACWDGIKR